MNDWVVPTFLNSISILGLWASVWFTGRRIGDLERKIDLELDKRMQEVRL